MSWSIWRWEEQSAVSIVFDKSSVHSFKKCLLCLLAKVHASVASCCWLPQWKTDLPHCWKTSRIEMRSILRFCKLFYFPEFSRAKTLPEPFCIIYQHTLRDLWSQLLTNSGDFFWWGPSPWLKKGVQYEWSLLWLEHSSKYGKHVSFHFRWHLRNPDTFALFSNFLL